MPKKPKTVEIKIEPSEGAAETTAAEAAKAAADEAAASVKAVPQAAPEKRPMSFEEAFDRLQRLQAEFDNYRRRTERERLETGAYAQGLLVERLLPVLDDFDRALAVAAGSDSPEMQGLALIREKLGRALAEAGLERIEAEGTPFDPDVHEALMTQEVEPEQDGLVIAELAPGYRFRGRMVRPARVQVGKAPDS